MLMRLMKVLYLNKLTSTPSTVRETLTYDVMESSLTLESSGKLAGQVRLCIKVARQLADTIEIYTCHIKAA